MENGQAGMVAGPVYSRARHGATLEACEQKPRSQGAGILGGGWLGTRGLAPGVWFIRHGAQFASTSFRLREGELVEESLPAELTEQKAGGEWGAPGAGTVRGGHPGVGL